MFSTIQKSVSSHPLFLSIFNPSYRSRQSMDDRLQNGSRKDFQTDMSINGEYFRSRTNNQYFCVVEKEKVEDYKRGRFTGDFRELDKVLKTRKYNPDKDVLLRLVFTDKPYFVESYQAITVKNPDVSVVDIPLDRLRTITPTFEPLPN
jgi:hypothetical protein